MPYLGPVLAFACGNIDGGPSEPADAPIPIIRESCADNALLAECAGTGGSGSTTGEQPVKVDETKDETDKPPTALELAQKTAENVLRANCGQCHGSNLALNAASGNMNYIDDMDALVKNGKIKPLVSGDSPIVRRMRDGSMPPAGSTGPRPTDQDIDIVARFVDNPIFWPGYATVKLCDEQNIALDDVYDEIASNLRKEDARDQPFFRYLTLTNRYNAGVCLPDLDEERWGLAKLVNSLSTKTRIEKPFAVNKDATIYRIDLRDYDWDRSITVNGTTFDDVWEAIVAESPYAVPFFGNEADDIREESGTDVAILPADALLDVAALGNLYYAIIGIDVDRTLSSFVSDDLGIDVVANLEQGEVVRAATTHSRISRQDRVLERHALELRNGAYWQSFDFASDEANQSIFLEPFGFNPGGTEAIFSLPNGLLGYVIADADDRIVEESNILLDTFQDDFIARTSVSCAGCHAQGFNPVVDEVGPFVKENRTQFNREDFEAVEEVYVPAKDFAQIITDDSLAYQRSVGLAGVPTERRDPVSNTFLRFDGDVDLATAAGDLGVSPAELKRNLGSLDPSLRVLETLRIDRNAFTALFAETLCVMQGASKNAPDADVCAQLLD